MTEAEIFVALAANDLKAIRSMLEFLSGHADATRLTAIAAEQAALRTQLEAMLNAAAN